MVRSDVFLLTILFGQAEAEWWTMCCCGRKKTDPEALKNAPRRGSPEKFYLRGPQQEPDSECEPQPEIKSVPSACELR